MLRKRAFAQCHTFRKYHEQGTILHFQAPRVLRVSGRHPSKYLSIKNGRLVHDEKGFSQMFKFQYELYAFVPTSASTNISKKILQIPHLPSPDRYLHQHSFTKEWYDIPK